MSSITIVIISNPLVPEEGREIVVQDWTGKSLLQILGAELPEQFNVCINGAAIESYSTIPAPFSIITVIPVILSGGDEESQKSDAVLRFALTAALSFFTMGIGGPLGFALFAGGSLAINAILPPYTPGPEKDKLDSFGIDGAKNTSKDGQPLPVVYGEYYQYGNVVALHTLNTDRLHQTVRILLAVCEGEIKGIDDSSYHFDEQPLSNFINVDSMVRVGKETQDVIPWFNEIYTPVNRAVELVKGTWETHTMSGGVDRVRFDVVMTEGLYKTRKDGQKVRELEVRFNAHYRVAGSGGAWMPMFPVREVTYTVMEPYTNKDGEEKEREVTYTRPSVPYNEGVSRTAAAKELIRFSFDSIDLDPNVVYETRFTVLDDSEDDSDYRIHRKMRLTDVVEVQSEAIRYNNTALVAFSFKLDEHLSKVPAIKYKVQGKLIEVYDAATRTWTKKWSDNPAWCAWDMLTNDLYGGGKDPSTLDMWGFVAWAEYCDAIGLRFNGAIAGTKDLWEAIQPIFRAGRAQIAHNGLKMSPIVEMPKAPTMMFNVSNIIEKSLSINWTAYGEYANEIHLKYYDETNQNKEEVLILRDPFIKNGVPVKVSELAMPGVVSRDQAAREATFALNNNKMSQNISFESSIESIACAPGDVIMVQHDEPKWGYGGRLRTGSNFTTLKLDKTVTVGAGVHQVLVRHDTIKLLSGYVVSQVVGNLVYLTSLIVADYADAQRLVHLSTGDDLSIVRGFVDGTGQGFILDNAGTIMAGDTVDVFVTDLVETITVTNTAGDTDTLTLTGPLARMPDTNTVYAFGPKDMATKQYVVRSITGNNDLVRTIEATEYDVSIFNDSPIEPVEPITPLPSANMEVLFGGMVEMPIAIGKTNRTDVRASWWVDESTYVDSEVFLSMNGEAFQSVGRFKLACQFPAEAEDEIAIKVVPRDAFGRSSSVTFAKIHRYTVVGFQPAPPVKPQSVSAVSTATSITLTWRGGALDDAGLEIPRTTAGSYEILYAVGEFATIASAVHLATVSANTLTHNNLIETTYYKYWVREINADYPTVQSANAPSDTGITVMTLAGQLYQDLFPTGITADHLAGELMTRIGDSTLETRIEMLAEMQLEGLLKVDELIGATGAVSDTMFVLEGNTATALAGMTTDISAIADDVATVAGSVGTVATTADDAALLAATADGKADTATTAAADAAADAAAAAAAAATADGKAVTADGKAVTANSAAATVAGNLALTDAQVVAAQGDIVDMAGRLSVVEVDTGTATAAVSVLSTASADLKAQHVIKTDINGYIAGFGLASEIINGDPTSAFVISADQFLIAAAGGGDEAGKPVFMVDSKTKEVSLNVLNVLKKIRSSNFATGVSGFEINAVTGSAEFNNATFRGDVVATNLVLSGTAFIPFARLTNVSIKGTMLAPELMTSASSSYKNTTKSYSDAVTPPTRTIDVSAWVSGANMVVVGSANCYIHEKSAFSYETFSVTFVIEYQLQYKNGAWTAWYDCGQRDVDSRRVGRWNTATIDRNFHIMSMIDVGKAGSAQAYKGIRFRMRGLLSGATADYDRRRINYMNLYVTGANDI